MVAYLVQIPALLFNTFSSGDSHMISLELNSATCKVGITESILSRSGEDLNWLIHQKFLEVSGTK